jgi:hypothetical protein
MKAAQNIGGTNYLLALIEAMKTKNPHPLSEKSSQIASNKTIIKWNKIVFKDKVDLIQSILDEHRSSEKADFNILNTQNQKRKKNIINMIRTLAPIEFVVTPQNPHDGGGFDFKVFETATDTEATLNPIFIAMFFCSLEFTKKALKHEASL